MLDRLHLLCACLIAGIVAELLLHPSLGSDLHQQQGKHGYIGVGETFRVVQMMANQPNMTAIGTIGANIAFGGGHWE